MKRQDFSKIRVFGEALLKNGSALRFEKTDGTIGELSIDDLEQIEAMVALSTGNVYYVHGTDGDDGYAGTKDQPKATWDAAINLCSAHDTIILLPGHSEDIDAASEIDLDVANVATYGIGRGSAQPKITFSNAVATIEINADNVHVQGVHFQATVTAVATGIDIKDGADDFSIVGCRFSAETLGTDEFEDAISVTTSDRGLIAYNYFDMDEAGAASAIHLVGACLGCNIIGNYVTGDYSVGCIEGITAAAEQVLIRGNTLINGVHSGLNTVACVSLFTGTTGVFEDNTFYTNVTAAQTAAVSADGCFIGRGNTVSTSAETAPLPLEGGASSIIRSAVATGKADETDGLALFNVTGNIYVHGITQRAEVAADSAVLLGVQVDATDTTLDSVLVTDTNLSTETSVGDYAVSNSAGGAFTVVQVENTTTSVMWDTPVIVPAGVIEQAASGTPGSLVSGYIIYWSEATAGATCVAA